MVERVEESMSVQVLKEVRSLGLEVRSLGARMDKLEGWMERLGAEFVRTSTESQREIQQVRTDLRAEIQQVRTDLRAEMREGFKHVHARIDANNDAMHLLATGLHAESKERIEALERRVEVLEAHPA